MRSTLDISLFLRHYVKTSSGELWLCYSMVLDRLTQHVHILEMNGDSYRLKQSRRKRPPSSER